MGLLSLLKAMFDLNWLSSITFVKFNPVAIGMIMSRKETLLVAPWDV